MESDEQMDTDVIRWYTGPEAARELGISPQRVSQLRLLGRLSGVQRGKTWFYSQETISGYLAKKGESEKD